MIRCTQWRPSGRHGRLEACPLPPKSETNLVANIRQISHTSDRASRSSCRTSRHPLSETPAAQNGQALKPQLATAVPLVRIQFMTGGRLCKSLTLLLGALPLVGPLALSACERSLFPPTAQRTPYERYQVLHGKYRTSSETNVYGGEQPALRQRLKPLDRP